MSSTLSMTTTSEVMQPPAPQGDVNPIAGLWFLGILLEIVSTMSGTVGKQLIRLSEHRRRQNALRQSMILFQIGILVNTIVGPLVDMAAYSFAAQSLIAPFGGLDVLWNAILAPWILKEKITPRLVLGCAFILVGTIMAGLFGNHEEPIYTLEYLEDLLINERVLIYFIAFLGWFLFNRFFLMRWATGSAIRGISLGITSGTIAGNMFCVKAAMELIQTSIVHKNGEIWLHWLPYVLLIGALFFAVSNVVYMTKGLQEYEALFMVTIYEGSMIVSGCVSGSVVLLDQTGQEAWRIGMYFFSVFIVVVGMCVIFLQERLAKSSLAAGTASIEEIQQAEWANSHGHDILHDIIDPRHRSLHASTSVVMMSESPRVSQHATASKEVAGLPADACTTKPEVNSTEGWLTLCNSGLCDANRLDTEAGDTIAPLDGNSNGTSGSRFDVEDGVPHITIIDIDERGVREKPERTDKMASALPPSDHACHEPRLEALSAASPTCCVVGESQTWCFGFVSPTGAPTASRTDSEQTFDRVGSRPSKGSAARQSKLGGPEFHTSCGPVECAAGRLVSGDSLTGTTGTSSSKGTTPKKGTASTKHGSPKKRITNPDSPSSHRRSRPDILGKSSDDPGASGSPTPPKDRE